MADIDLFELAPVAMAVLDSDLRCVRCNKAMARIYGHAGSEIHSKTVRELIPDLADETEPVFRKVIDTGDPVLGFRSERVSPRSLRKRSWVQNVVPLARRDGGKNLIMVSVQETTALDTAEQALRETEHRLHTYQQMSLDGFSILRAVRDERRQVVDFVWEFCNPAAERMANIGPMSGRSMLQTMPETGAHPAFLQRYAHLLETGESDIDEIYYEGDNTSGWFRNNVIPLDPDRIAVCWRDITARKEAEEELKLVSGEYRHRIKNLLTIVSSLIAHAGRTAPDAAALGDTIQRQIQALASAQDLIGHTPRSAVQLEELVIRACQPFRETALEIIGGPPVALPQRHAIPIVLAIHELATNALKHGGLSKRGASVRLGWSEGDGTVSIRWVEQLEPGRELVRPPDKPSGFGSRLFSMVGRSLPEGRIKLDWEPGGLEAMIAFSIDDDLG